MVLSLEAVATAPPSSEGVQFFTRVRNKIETAKATPDLSLPLHLLQITMSTTLSPSDLSTRVSSLWKGYRVRKIFADLHSVNSWDEYDSLLLGFTKKLYENPSLADLRPAWNLALDKINNRLSAQDIYEHCACSGCNYYEDDDDEPSDWYWNDGGGYADW